METGGVVHLPEMCQLMAYYKLPYVRGGKYQGIAEAYYAAPVATAKYTET